MNYKQWLEQAVAALQQANPKENAKVDALVLLQHATGKSRTQILAFDDTELTEEVRSNLTALFTRRLQGEPIAYILGEKEFWSLPLNVAESTLIPRPDTEILVEKALNLVLDRIKNLENAEMKGEKTPFRILDLGTGTGAIALALAFELQPIFAKLPFSLEIIGADLMAEAVELARSNAVRNQLNVQFVQGHWFTNITGKFDLIVSNPPYIDKTDVHLSQGDVRFEPLSALVAEEEGLADLRHIIEHAPDYLQPNSYLILEHGWDQGEKVRSIFSQHHWQQITTEKDYGNNERITLGCWKTHEI